MSPFNEKTEGLTAVKLELQALISPKIVVLESDQFVPQENTNTCWAACLTSILKQFKFTHQVIAQTNSGNQIHNRAYTEKFFYGSNARAINNTTDFQNQANKVGGQVNVKLISFNTDELGRDKLVKSITKFIRSSNYCIWYFKIKDSTEGHFVIIYGYETNLKGTWLYVFDPKPDKLGQHYVINSKYFCESPIQGLFRILNKGKIVDISPGSNEISIPNIGEKVKSERVKYIREFVSASSLCLRRSLNLDKDIIEEDTIFIGYNAPKEAILLDLIPNEVGQSTAFRRFTHLIPMVKKVKDKRGNESLQFLCGFFFRKDVDYFDRVNGLGEFNDNVLLKSYIEQNYTKEGFGISVFMENECYLAAVVSTKDVHQAFILGKNTSYFSKVLDRLRLSGTQIEVMNPNPILIDVVIRDNRW
ncbi:MAG: hypothetical protein KF870_09490 [Leadbetterella sp.]|nr:hypothetical protein [Leadbetterella sp.]